MFEELNNELGAIALNDTMKRVAKLEEESAWIAKGLCRLIDEVHKMKEEKCL